jgi:hypothetical protein
MGYGDRQGWMRKDMNGIYPDWDKAIPNWYKSNETESLSNE